MIVHFIFFHPPFLRTATSLLAEDAPGRSRDGDRGKKSKVLGSSPVQSQQLDHSYPGALEHILELEHLYPGALEHSYLGARIFISWSWNIHILERRNTHILEHLYLGARIFMLWSWTIHILDLEHSHFTAGTLGGEHLQS